MSESVVGSAVSLEALIPDARCRVWSWLPREEIDEGAFEQIANLAHLPPAFHVAVMPDVHKGYGMPIGTALATKGAVVPYAVGVDIGCGMVAVKTNIAVENATQEAVREALVRIYAAVPVGQPTKQDRNAGSHKDRQNSVVLRTWAEDSEHIGDWTLEQIKQLRERADRQLGTLGGGNHFIELQAGSDGFLWLMFHTGSRAFGKAICDYYHKKALDWCERYHTPLPDKDLAFLSLDTQDGQDYMRDMGYAMTFAEESRSQIEGNALGAMAAVWGPFEHTRIETHHNFASIEKHLGQWVVVHRKGAVKTLESVKSGVAVSILGTNWVPAMVTIPGSMQTGSYIGEGRASPLALNTCSHGAGRRLGRNETKRQNVGVDIKAEMEAQGIVLVCPPTSDTLDEAGRAYKDIENVMARQADLVEPRVSLRPLGVVKG